MTAGEWIYLGDGVYSRFDGYGIILHANSHDVPTDVIYLDPEVLKALYHQYIKGKLDT